MNNWFYSDAQKTYGPISKEQLVSMTKAGQLNAGHFIMAEGAQEWQELGSSPFAGYLPPKANPAVPVHFVAAAPQASPVQVLPFRPASPGQPQVVKPATGPRNLWVGTLIALVAALGWYFLAPKSAPARTLVMRLEGETLKVSKVTGGEVEPQPMRQSNALWSGDAHLWWHGGSAGYSLDLEFTVEQGQAGSQRVKAAFTSSVDYGVIEVSLDGKKLRGKIFDLQANDAVISGACDLGLHDLAAGPHVLRIGILDSHVMNMDKRDAYGVGLDYLQLEPPLSNATPAAAGTNIASKAQPSASFATGKDHVRVMNTMEERHGRKSNDQSQPRFTWHPHKSGAEWAQYEWEAPQVLGECRVFWFDDSSVNGGGCALPAFWRLLYREESTGAWVPVDAAMPAATRDEWNIVKFTPVKTTALRLAVQCLDDWSAGVCHWQALAADPADVPDFKNREHPDLFLGDLSPQHTQLIWGRYRANSYGQNDARAGRGVFFGGKACSQFLWAHANSRIDFAIPAGYTRFTAFAIGPSERSTGTPIVDAESWKASVLVDGRLMDQSDPLSSYKTHEHAVDIAIPAGSKTLTLITDDLGNDRIDHAFWAYPTLLTAESQKRPATPVKAHADDLLFLPVPLPEGTLLTSKLSTAPILVSGTGAKLGLRFINQTPVTAKIHWLPGNGKQHTYADILPGRDHVMITYEGHVWLITDEADKPLAIVKGSAASPVICIDGPGSAGSPATEPVRETVEKPKPSTAAALGESTLENVWKNRSDQRQRIEMLRRTGGSPEVEAAVSAAFEYMKAKQNRDGSWGTHHPVGDTALALLAYAGRCETADSRFYGDTIMKGIMFIIETGKKNSQGAFVSDSDSGQGALIHACATVALGQMYLAARYGSKSLPGMREAFEKGVQHMIETNPSIVKSAINNVWELAWQCEALHTAKLTGLKFVGLEECVSRTTSALRKLQNADGGFGEQSDKPDYMTGHCVRALQLFPEGSQSQLENGIRFARSYFQKQPLSRENFAIHSALFYTRAFYRTGGDDWRFWNAQMLPVLLARAKPDGSFSLRSNGDDIDMTALGILILETYYGGDLYSFTKP